MAGFADGSWTFAHEGSSLGQVYAHKCMMSAWLPWLRVSVGLGFGLCVYFSVFLFEFMALSETLIAC